jgi:hypothetical protein
MLMISQKENEGEFTTSVYRVYVDFHHSKLRFFLYREDSSMNT